MPTSNGNGRHQIAVPPHNHEAEQSVLGSILLSDRLLPAMVLEVGLSQADFYRERHGVVFAAMRALHQANEPIDHLTVSEQLQRQGQLEEVGGSGAIEELAGWVPAAGHGVQYARIVRELSQMRRLLSATYEIQAEIAERRQGGGGADRSRREAHLRSAC